MPRRCRYEDVGRHAKERTYSRDGTVAIHDGVLSELFRIPLGTFPADGQLGRLAVPADDLLRRDDIA